MGATFDASGALSLQEIWMKFWLLGGTATVKLVLNSATALGSATLAFGRRASQRGSRMASLTTVSLLSLAIVDWMYAPAMVMTLSSSSRRGTRGSISIRPSLR